MCLSPAIIVNPTYVKSCNQYPMVHLNTRDFMYYHKFPYEFDYRQFGFRKNGVTYDNIDKYYAYNVSGETIPVYITVPCGKCNECISVKQSDILRRCYLEEFSSKHRAMFLTLTYNDKCLPKFGVNVDDVQRFFKRLRINLLRKYGYSEPIRYALFSEYGKLNQRPHYHAIIFNFDTKIFPRFLDCVHFFEENWNLGFIQLKHFDDSKGLAYCTKYIMKEKFVPFGKSPNFWLASRSGGGLGSPCLRNKDFCISALRDPEFKVTVKVLGDVKTFHLPKYIYNKLLPRAKDFYPPKIRSAVKELCYKLILLHTFNENEMYDEYTSRHPYLFPPNLLSKYSLVYPEYFQTYAYNFDDSEYKMIISTIDVPAISTRIDELIQLLDDFHLDLDAVLNADTERELHMRPFVEHCLRYIASLPCVTERAQVLLDECIQIECRIADFQ